MGIRGKRLPRPIHGLWILCAYRKLYRKNRDLSLPYGRRRRPSLWPLHVILGMVLLGLLRYPGPVRALAGPLGCARAAANRSLVGHRACHRPSPLTKLLAPLSATPQALLRNASLEDRGLPESQHLKWRIRCPIIPLLLHSQFQFPCPQSHHQAISGLRISTVTLSEILHCYHSQILSLPAYLVLPSSSKSADCGVVHTCTRKTTTDLRFWISASIVCRRANLRRSLLLLTAASTIPKVKKAVELDPIAPLCLIRT